VSLVVDLGGFKALQHVDITCHRFRICAEVLRSAMQLQALNIAVKLLPQLSVTICLEGMEKILEQVDASARYSLQITVLHFADTDLPVVEGYFRRHMPTFIARKRLKVFRCDEDSYNPSHPSFVRII
jgi:hypothetical protein